MSPDTIMKTAGPMAAGASTILNGPNLLVNGRSYGWGDDNVNANDNVYIYNINSKDNVIVNVNGTPSMYHLDNDNE